MMTVGRRALLGSLMGGATLGGAAWWRRGRGRALPEEGGTALFAGIFYVRQVRRSPRPQVRHWLHIALDMPGLHFLVTPGDPRAERPLTGKTTTQFLKESGCQVAINADFFSPWCSNGFWDYYPHVGDPVSPQGNAMSEGRVYAVRAPHPIRTTLWISRENELTIEEERPADAWNACGGHRLPLDGGANQSDLAPCLALGIGPSREAWVLLIDGRQKGYSEGVTPHEMASLLKQRGATAALLLDGGGSATLVCARKNSPPTVLNSPIDCKIPGRERAVANHLGIFARSLS